MSNRTANMFSATEITNFLACRHLTTLERARAEGSLRRPFRPKAELELLRGLGLDHERGYLVRLTEDFHMDVVEMPTGSWAAAARATAHAMRIGTQVIYQATFDEPLGRGRADFLIRVERPSYLGFWSYEAVEAKLARSTKADALIQLCFYSEALSSIQGALPEYMHVVLGGGTGPESFRVARYVAYFRRVRREFEQSLGEAQCTYPDPVEHCQTCWWQPHCEKQWRADDYLSLIAGITRNQRKALAGHTVSTVAGVARLELPAAQIPEIGDSALRRIRDQASLQVRGREQHRHIYELLQPIEPERGLAALPPPSAGDLFLDFESSRFAFEDGLEYLTGFETLDSDGPAYQCLWALDPSAEKSAFENLIRLLTGRLERFPDMHVYHYASYEPTAIKRLAGRHGVCADEVDHFLRAGLFVDLFRVVRQGLRASVESYSIKRLEPLYGFVRSVPLTDANLAMDIFGTGLALGSAAARTREILTAIEGYNQDDCLSALRLRDWLERLRNEFETASGIPIPRPAPKPGEPPEKLAEYLAQVRAVEARLLEGLPSSVGNKFDERPPEWLLAQLLEWHRREDKSAWWEYFRLCDLSDDELQEDKDALAGLIYAGAVRPEKKSVIHRYTFPPQDHSMDRAHTAHDPRTQANAGEIVAIDESKRTIDLKRSASSTAPHPTALIPYDVVPSPALRDSLLRIGAWVAEHGIESAGPYRCGRDLLLRQRPRMSSDLNSIMNAGPDFLAGATRVVFSLVDTVLAIQGPPGSGKTHTASRIILELIKQGKRVGITAASHKVISHLLNKVCEAANDLGLGLKAVQKPGEGENACDHPSVVLAKNNDAVCAALGSDGVQLAAGTAWLWAREAMASSVDYLFVDEAGQMSLANVLAVSQAARNLVLVGDPQQLDQPQRGVHPPGAGASALSHLLGGKATIAQDRGLFLPDTWRLHPDLCAFTSEVFYESRLNYRPENRNQRINTAGALAGTGLRFCPVTHEGNQSESPEEVERIAQLFAELLSPFPRVPASPPPPVTASPEPGSEWTDKHGQTHPLTLNDILVVTPYNAQVGALVARLPDGARVGTVDKFQGQEAPVVIYSMATSMWEDAPRGMEFLYSLNRLNVATSRAKCVVVLVASPALFTVQCKTPRQMELANAFCRFLELAKLI